MNLTKPSETLDIYYSKVSVDGKSIRPSYLIQEMQRLFSGLEIEDEEKQAFSAQEWTPKLGMQKVIRGFQDGNAMDQEWQELYLSLIHIYAGAVWGAARFMLSDQEKFAIFLGTYLLIGYGLSLIHISKGC